MKRFHTYTDESGITSRPNFIVATVIVDNNNCEKFEDLLEKIETESRKKKKWADVVNERRKSYTKLLLKKNVFNLCTVYFSIFNNKQDYVPLVSSQVAKSIISYADNNDYKSTIILDEVNKKTTEKIKKDIKQYKIKFKKIIGLDDNNSVGLKFADSICGLIRDVNNSKIDLSYKTIFKKLKQT